MLDHTKKPGKQEVPTNSVEFTQRGKAPKEVQADLLAGEPDDLAIEFTNRINYHEGGSK